MKKKVVILGAGVTGLATAYRLSQNHRFDVHVVERESVPGGVCRSFQVDDFILDHGPHKFYSLLPGVTEELCEMMGDELLEREKTQKLFMHGKYFSYPLKMGEMIMRFPPQKVVKILSSFGMQGLHKLVTNNKDISSYEDYIIDRFGKGLYEEILKPMTEKTFGNPKELDRKLAEVRISSPGLLSVIKDVVTGALLNTKSDKNISAPTFHYPKYGFGKIPEHLYEKSKANGVNFHLSSSVVQIKSAYGKVSSILVEREGEIKRLGADYVVYTLPLSHLPQFLENPPFDIKGSLSDISYRNAVIYYYLLKSQPVLPAMWAFFPEKKFRFGRVSEMTRFSPYTCPKDHTAIMVDFTCAGDEKIWSMDDKDLGDFLYTQIEPLGLFKKSQIISRFSKRIKNFYPVYQMGFRQKMSVVRALESALENLFFIGRLGDFNYNNSDQCLDMGFRLASHIAAVGEKELEKQRQWKKVRKEVFESYRIVD